MTWPSLAIRESTTLSSKSSQKGHFTRVPRSYGRCVVEMKHRESFAESLGLLAHLALRPLVLRFLKHAVDQRDNFAHFPFLHAAGRDDRRTQSDPTRDGRRFLIERHSILVHGDAFGIERGLGFFAGYIFRGEIDEHQMRVGPA